MSLLEAFHISTTGVVANSQRLNVIASNLANAESVTSPDGQPYKARKVVFEALLNEHQNPATLNGAARVQVKSIVNDERTPMKKVYEPTHPLADASGYVTYPNVNAVEEVTDMMAASQSYRMNIDTGNRMVGLMYKTLAMGKG
jgi:flagellar basal-body rod protein FlgC